MSSHPLARPVAFSLSLLALACTPEPGSSPDTGSSTNADTTTTSDETTSGGTTSASFTSGQSITAAEDSSSTGAPEPMEYVGTWSTGFGFSYFQACGEAEQWVADGLPGFEICEEDALWLRVVGVELPPEEGSSTPILQVMEILEGPCIEGSCDGSIAIGGECGSFDELCNEHLEFECDLLAQDCPVDEKCAPWANDGGMELNATHCVPLAPMPGMAGDPCVYEESAWSGMDDCDIGLLCWDLDAGTDQGECAPLCDQSLMPDPVCPMGTSCMPFFGVEPSDRSVGVCAAE